MLEIKPQWILDENLPIFWSQPTQRRTTREIIEAPYNKSLETSKTSFCALSDPSLISGEIGGLRLCIYILLVLVIFLRHLI